MSVIYERHRERETEREREREREVSDKNFFSNSSKIIEKKEFK